MSIQSSPQH